MMVGATVFGEVDDQLTRIEPGVILKVGDVTQTREMQYSNIPFDSFRISEELQNEAVMNTGVNPQGMTLPMSSTPATNTLSMKETMNDVMNMYEDNLMAGMCDWGTLLRSRFCQFYSQPTKKAALELNKKEMRELRLEDIDLYKDDKGNYNYREIKGSKIIPLDSEMFDWSSDPRIYVSPDFVSPISKAFEMRKAQEILPQLVQLAGGRNTVMQNGEPAVVDIRKLVRWYLEQMDMDDEDLIIDEDEDRIDEIKQAIKQQEDMQAGKNVEGRPGEPIAHRYAHAIELLRVNDTMAAEEFGMMMQSNEPKIVAFAQAMDTYRRALTEHVRIDNLLVQQASDAAVSISDTTTQGIEQIMNPQPQVMPQMTAPMNNMVTVPTVTGNQGLPNAGGMPVPNNMSSADITGQMAGAQV
jgi:hypothetical protein